jgi:hypothetical protein
MITIINRKTAVSDIRATVNEIKTEAEFTEDHIHSKNRALGKKNPQTATVWAELQSLNPFVVTSGNNDFGAAEQLIGSADTPFIVGELSFDCGDMLITATSATTPYIIRTIFGTVDAATAEAAGDFSEIQFMKESASGRATIVRIGMPAIVSGTKVWAKVKNASNGETISFLLNIHHYDIVY